MNIFKAKGTETKMYEDRRSQQSIVDNGITAEMMYNEAKQNGTAGFAPVYAWSWWAIKSFNTILKSLNNTANQYNILFNFMALADVKNGWVLDTRSVGNDSIGNNNNKPSGNKWSAFSLVQHGSSCRLHYAHWNPFGSIYGDLPIHSGDIDRQINGERFVPFGSTITIGTLRKSLSNVHCGYKAANTILNGLISTLDSIDHHVDSEDNRRIYNQYSNGTDYDNNGYY